MHVSCLLPVHAGAHPPHVNISIKSIVDQSRQPDELLLLQDGPVPHPIKEDLTRWKNEKDWIEVIECDENRGIAATLRDGVEQAEHDVIARMDADDISVKDRFERQIRFLHDNPSVDVCGGWIEEFTKSGETSIRKVPTDHTSIVQYARRRSPFNHVSVMMKREAILNAGNYREMDPTEDYDLWMRMLANGATFANIDDVLVQVRGGEDMFHRRGGIKYARHEIRQFYEFVDIGTISWFDFIINVLIRVPVRILPAPIRKQVYNIFVRA